MAPPPQILKSSATKTAPSNHHPQPFSTQPITNTHNPEHNTTTSPPPPYHFRILDFRAIFTSPATSANVARALDRTCEAFAFYLLDLDLLDEPDLVLRFGPFAIDFYDLALHLQMLAVKAVVMKLLELIAGGFLGFVKGEVMVAGAGTRMMFTFGVVGGQVGEWGLRRREVGGDGMGRVS